MCVSLMVYIFVVVSNKNAWPSTWNGSPSVSDEEVGTNDVYVIDVYPHADGMPDPIDPSSSRLDSNIGISLYFQHTKAYPESSPRVHVSSIRGLSTQQVEQCCACVTTAMEEHAGIPMIYTLVEVVQEWINALEDSAKETLRADDPAMLEMKQRQEEEQRIQNLRAHGHEVTRESFLAWKEQFMLEQRQHVIERPTTKGGGATASAKNTMTGKQWFLQQQQQQHLGEGEESDAEEYEDEISMEDIEGGEVFDDDSDDSDLEETLLSDLYEEFVEDGETTSIAAL